MKTTIYLDVYLNGKRQLQVPFRASLQRGTYTCPLWEMKKAIEDKMPSLSNKPYKIKFNENPICHH